MLTREELYVLMRTIERSYSCRICIIDGEKNYLFSTNFPTLDTTQLSDICNYNHKHRFFVCRQWDDFTCLRHSVVEKDVYYSICPFGAMNLVGTISLPGIRRFNLFCGAFKPRQNLPANSFVSPRRLVPDQSFDLTDLSDEDFGELPRLWRLLIRELTSFLHEQLLASNRQALRFTRNRSPQKVVHDFINGNFRHPLRLSQVASLLGWTQSHATVKIREMFGKTFTELVNERRIENAKWLLRNRYPLPVSNIGKVSGFRSAPHFFRLFQRLTGMTPREFQASCQDTAPEPVGTTD